MKPRFSFIIPALNEEKMIADVISNIKKINHRYRYEIIVADGNSTDKTREMAKASGAKVVRINKNKVRTIALGRNTGANIARGDLLVFCDADTMITNVNMFISKINSVFNDKSVVAATPKIKVFEKEHVWKDSIVQFFYNATIRFSFKTKYPFCGGQCQIIRADAFRKIHGYDSQIVHGEDTELFRKLRSLGRIHFFSDLVVYESSRRYRSVGYFRLFFKGLYSFVYRALFHKNAYEHWNKVDEDKL